MVFTLDCCYLILVDVLTVGRGLVRNVFRFYSNIEKTIIEFKVYTNLNYSFPLGDQF